MEYLVGYCVGISQTIIGYPFDTIKTRLQTNSIKIMKPKSIWMGIRYPLINSTLINTITFGNRDYFIRKTDNYVLSYTLVGLINGVVQNQLDNAKVKSQVTGEVAKLPRKFVFNGMKYSVLLESFSMPIYFLTFDYLEFYKDYSFKFSDLTEVIDTQINSPSVIINTKELPKVIPSAIDYCWIIIFFFLFILINFLY